MAVNLQAKLEEARQASGRELRGLLHDPSEEVLAAVLANPNLSEEDLGILLERLDLPASLLGGIAARAKWTRSEAVRLRLARHPHTPFRIAATLVRRLFLFDLVSLSLQPSVPAPVRRLAEQTILERLPKLTTGEKLTLARRGSGRIAAALLAEAHPTAAALALENPFLSEAQVLRVIVRPGLSERVILAVAQHPKWSCQYNVRLALVRNPLVPLGIVLRFLRDLTLGDLRILGSAQALPENLRGYIRREMARRRETVRKSHND